MADEPAEPLPFRLQLFSSLRPVRHKHHKKHHKKHHHHGPKTGHDVAKAAEAEGQTPASIVRRLIQAKIDEGPDSSFFVADLGSVVRQHRKWRKLLPRVEPFYAIKCNTDRGVLKTLLPLASGFDCASMGEIASMLQLGVTPERIIYANPCKAPSHIHYAKDQGVNLMTFDNEDELRKVHSINPDAKMVIRILTDDSHSLCRFGTKFGAHPEDTLPLLQAAKELGMDVVGVSFHVGSGCLDPMAYDDAVRRAKAVFDQGASLGYSFNLLDLGGGFPGGDSAAPSSTPGQGGGSSDDSQHEPAITFEQIAAVLNPVLEEVFPDHGVRVIAEPGRFFVAAAFTLAVNITSRRVIRHDKTGNGNGNGNGDTSGAEDNGQAVPSSLHMYYVGDGVYGSFNCLIFDHWHPHPKVLRVDGRAISEHDEFGPEQLFDSSVWGPTCDSIDCITHDVMLPEMKIGDWMMFEDMGAYTVSAASHFNGFDVSKVYYVNTEEPHLPVRENKPAVVKG